MDIKELNKTQLILLTLLITFVVSIATGIITVSIMQQMPKSVPQTINNVIQRTIEKITTAPAVITVSDKTEENKTPTVVFGEGDAVINIYSIEAVVPPPTTIEGETKTEAPKPLGQGIIISDTGLVLVDSDILVDKELYKVVLDKIEFDATILMKFPNGFTVLKISPKKVLPVKEEPKKDNGVVPPIDNKP
ncbi:MAG: hypothetical protein AAB477_02500 [Patescibacteria group bacterium]